MIPFGVGNGLTTAEVALGGMLFEKLRFFSFLSRFYMLLLG